MRLAQLLGLALLAIAMGCNRSESDLSELGEARACICAGGGSSEREHGFPVVRGALLASRFASLEAFKEEVQVEYFKGGELLEDEGGEASVVRLTHCSHGLEVVSILRTGITEGDFKEARDGSVWDRIGLGFGTPFAVANRSDMKKVYVLSRRRPNWFGQGDVAFYDLAEVSVANINTEDLAYPQAADSSEKGYINTFNHMTAQALITTFFSEELADFVADVHERHHMPELITSQFTEEQLANPENDPLDNYVDIVNNEWGQELGKKLKEKYNISRETHLSPGLLANYMNDIQSYYSWSFQIGFRPFNPEDEVVYRFSEKMNLVMKAVPE